MTERNEYIPTMNISNTAPLKICHECGKTIVYVFYVRGERILCANCRP